MTEKIEIAGFRCACTANKSSRRVVYMIYPQVNGFSDEWLEAQAEANGCSIVAVYIPLNQWNELITPWPEPGETPKAEPFGGKGKEFLATLQGEIIPQAENSLALDAVTERDLIGVSLAGLFTLWQWIGDDTFQSIACLSGSFWYAGFMEWFDNQEIAAKRGKAYFLLGKEEPKSHIKAYRSVGVNTEAVVARLKSAGIDTIYEEVAGNHFANPMERAAKALGAL